MSYPGVDWEIVSSLKAAIRDCSARRLTVATKWASELLLSIPEPKRDAPEPLPERTFATSTPARSRSPHASVSFNHQSPGPSQAAHESQHSDPELDTLHHPDAPTFQPLPDEVIAQEQAWEAEEEDRLIAAQAYYDAREFLRACDVLEICRSSRARFLYFYSRFMFTEKKAEREWHLSDKKRDQPPVPINTSLRDLFLAVQNSTDPWLLFLKALFLRRLGRREEAVEASLLSLSRYPWNWSAWMLLGKCLGDGEELQSMLPFLPLPPTHPLVHLFQVKVSNDLASPSDNELALCDRLLTEKFFPGNTWLMAQKATILFHMHLYVPAGALFEKIIAKDPHRIDDLDTYSAILFVLEEKVKLSKLAFDFLEQERDRPEICCVIGNHFSSRNDHQRAIHYYMRATQLDRTYLEAWTLLGHEYIEEKNGHAAVAAYRAAADADRKDYRAWYGLAQAYELLGMYTYALYYYHRATALKPYDVRIWQATGNCYADMGRPREAIECLKHALQQEHPLTMALLERVAKLYTDLEEYGEAAAHHRRIVELAQSQDKTVEEFSKSYMFVARYHMYLGGGDLNLAKEYLEILSKSHAEEVAQASDLLKKVRILIEQKPDAQGRTVKQARVADVES
ncbi:TPR-like protein [Neolentinus lepideus HHB14362 ss-1]|uniref:TPR-like protein n=1 Tax=Neolentinus lepideus HHB14362 ss-1 TaxID=1314782 RepID=A0A165V0A9_9AGAM|nr:TPR-like protein [Neolentinus lepideus HHB14362 ss-1]